MNKDDLIRRLLDLAQMAVDKALDINYDDPEDHYIYRELRELKPIVKATLADPASDEVKKLVKLLLGYADDQEESGWKIDAANLRRAAWLLDPQ
jgi:hypothetical protein